MEETELEEGEACLNKNDVDKNYDPDVALAYIDEKLEHVLGHFQKDFEGGVSAENLGSKFGGYGSFLPTYQRSPVWSHPKSPQKLQKSPHNLPPEGARGHSVSSSASVSGRHGSTALVVAKLPVPRASDDCVRREVKMPLTHPENKSDSQSDQKNFKVRIKMVSDNMSTKKNAEIYSGLGLDVSPTSSFEDSPTDCKLAREPQNLPKESPTSILKIMTSKPLHGILLLSPLHNDLICLTDKEMHFRESRAVSIRHRGSQEDSLISVNGSDSGRSNKKLVGEKKPKKSEKKAFTAELKNSNVYTTQDGVDAILKQETDVDASVCDETARKADIPRVVNRSGTKEENFHGLAKDEPRGPPSIQEDGFVGKANEKAVSCTKITHSYDDESGYPDKGGNLNGERINIPLRVDPHMSRERKGVNSELMDHAKHRSGQKSVSSVDDDTKVSSGKENSSSGSKRKSKGVQSRDAEIITDMRNAFTKTDVVSAPNSRKNTILKTHMSTSQVNDSKQDVGNPKDRYKDFFGDLEELGDDDMADDMPSVDKLSNCPTVDKGSGEFNSVSENQSSSKQINQVSRSHAYGRADSSLVPPTGYRPIPDVGAPLSQLVKEDWVCCDKCQKWRLLPAGKNPQSLPKTWLCNMLNWVDGMNRCSISEEETTKAVLALHQNFATAPRHEGQNSQNRYSGVVSSGVVDALHADQSLQDVGGRKQHGFRDVYNASSHNGSSPYIDSKKKIPQAPVKTRSLNGESHSPSLDEVDFEHSGQSSGLVGQKRRHRKEKSIPLANPLEGDSKSSKIRISSENNQEYHKAPKKLKAGSVHIDEDWKSDNGGSALKVCRSSTNGLSMNKSREHQHKHEDHPKDSKRDLKVSVRNSEDRTQFSSDASLLRTENQIDIDVKKRKFSEYEEIQLYTTSRSNAGHRLEDRRDSLEETSESNHRKEKKARVPNSGEKESSMSKGSGRIDNKGGSVKDQQAGKDRVYSQSRRSLDVVDLVQKDIGYTQPPVAATSSSSKVSSSRKSKTNFQERKGSPVESVSSSPLRVLNQDKFMLTRRDLGGKRDSEEAVMVASSPRKCSNGEDGAQIDQSRMVQKNVTITTTKQGSLESSMHDIQDRNQSHISRRKALQEAVSTHDVTDTFKSDQYPCKPLISEHCPNDESGKRNQYHSHGSRRKSGKGSSSRSKEKSRGTRSESEKGNLREAESNGDHVSHNENSKARSKLQEKIAINSEKIEKNICKNELAANPSTESGKREAQSNLASFDSSNIRRFISNHGSEHNHPMDRNNEKSLKRFPTDKTDRVDVIGKGKPHSLPPSGRGQNDMTRCPQPINGIQNDIGVNLLTVRTSDGDDALKANKQIKKSENQSGNGNQPSNSRNPTNGHKGRDIDAPSPIRRDSTSQAASNAVKEAKDLKHLADRLKNSGSILESMGLYFQAALKFLYGASLLESSNSENSKHGEAIQSMQMYSSTAKLCEFCAHEYEKLKDMASAALAYKCVEVAYLRVIYSSHSSASKDRQELQTALQIVPPGESPSSSASDVDNLNNIATSDKVTVTKGVNSTQVAGNHVIPAQNRPNFVRLLNFVQDVNFAMEASRKSRTAFGTASAREETKYREGLPSVKKALDFNFQDMEGFLRLVRLAMEAISH